MSRGAESGGHDAQRTAHLHQHFPHARGDAGAQAQLKPVLARVAGAADRAALALGGGMQDADLRPAIILHRLEIDVHQRLQQIDGVRPLDGEHRPQAADVAKDNLLAGTFGPLLRKVGVDPIDDLGVVAGVDHQEEKRLAVGVEIIADQHVVEDSAVVVGHQGVADLAQFHVGHAAGEQFGQEDGLARPLESQPAHVRNVGDSHRRADGQMLFDDRGILHGHGPAGEVDHPPAVGNMPII